MYIRHPPHSQGKWFLTTGEALQALPAKETGPARASLEDKDVIIVQDGTDETTIAPIGGSGVQICVEQIAVSGRRRLAQPSRDTASGGPIRPCHHLAQFPVEVWRRRPSQVQQD